MRLKVKANYANQAVAYQAGNTIEVDDEMAAWLMADSPGTFEEEPEKKAPAKGASNAKK